MNAADELVDDRMLGDLSFCPDSREIFERLRGLALPGGQPGIMP